MSGDLISRRTAIDTLYKLFRNRPLDYDRVQICGDVLMKIENLPSAERRGRWKETTILNLWECSVCGGMIYSETVLDRKTFHKWCGRCGAKMDLSADELLKMPPDDGSTIPKELWKMDEVDNENTEP